MKFHPHSRKLNFPPPAPAKRSPPPMKGPAAKRVKIENARAATPPCSSSIAVIPENIPTQIFNKNDKVKFGFTCGVVQARLGNGSYRIKRIRDGLIITAAASEVFKFDTVDNEPAYARILLKACHVADKDGCQRDALQRLLECREINGDFAKAVCCALIGRYYAEKWLYAGLTAKAADRDVFDETCEFSPYELNLVRDFGISVMRAHELAAFCPDCNIKDARSTVHVILKDSNDSTDMFQCKLGCQAPVGADLYGSVKFHSESKTVEWDCDWCRVCDGSRTGNVTGCDVCLAYYHKACLPEQYRDTFRGSDAWICPLCAESLQLQEACAGGQVKRIARLISQGHASPFWRWQLAAPIHGVVGNNGMTALHIAAWRNDLLALNLMMYPFISKRTNAYCANNELAAVQLHIKDGRGRTAINTARANGSLECEMQLVQRGSAALRASWKPPALHDFSDDVAHGAARVPIRWRNDVDESPLPSFLFTTSRLQHHTVVENYYKPVNGPARDLAINVSGCASCNTECQALKLRTFERENRNQNDVVQCAKQHVPSKGILRECNFMCACSAPSAAPQLLHAGRKACYGTCARSSCQMGLTTALEVFKISSKMGWGCRTLQPIKRGTAVVEYIGELISGEEANRREKKRASEGMQHSYVWDLKDGKSIDATEIRNVAAFFNHSCVSYNIKAQNVLYHCEDESAPRIVFFARRDIKKGEELLTNYGNAPPGCRCADCSKTTKG